MVLAKGLRDDPKEEILISGGGDGAIKLWIIGGEDGAISELHKLDDGRDEGESVLSLVLDGTFLYAGRINGEVNVWDLETRQLVRNLKTKTEDVLALSLGGGYLFCAGVSGIVEASSAEIKMDITLTPHRNSTVNTSWCRVSRPTTDGYWRPRSRSSGSNSSTSREATTTRSRFGISAIVLEEIWRVSRPAMV